jgi:phosphoglycolate phosphatase
MPFNLLVFDLDGTLIDSRVDLANSVNATLHHLGRPGLPRAVIASYIGDGASMMLRRALGDPTGEAQDEETIAAALDFFLAFYREHKLDHTFLYPGVLEALEEIRQDRPKLPMAVLTNKPVRPSREICAHFGLDRFFFQNYGGDSFHRKKPDPLGLLTLMREAGVRLGRPVGPGETLMIGDSGVDVLTGHNASVRSLGCTFGLAPQTLSAARPTATVDSPSEWPAAILALETLQPRPASPLLP